ncbi:JAB N-terminal domain-containing protein [Actinoplanes sp. CA-015351]|uniref:JAB N-terminal domain-containing protein n=1 Tax=Actinoplanes sp. CA-015351 TaxID=3239897 RepID=UPI003D957BE3
MTRWLEVLRGPNGDYHERINLEETLLAAARREMGLTADVPVALAVVQGPDRGHSVRNPDVVNVDPHYGSVVFTMSADAGIGQAQHRYLSEFLGPYLQEHLRRSEPGEQHWEFRIITAEGADDLRRPAPLVDKAVEVDMGRPRTRQARIRRVEGPDLAAFDPAEHDVDPGDLRATNVVLTAETHQQLNETLPLSDRTETGGFLAGTAHTVAGRPGAHLVRVTRVIPAEHTGAGPAQFTFTPDSFVALSGLLDEASGEVLLGWYHSHLFSSASRLALSGTDVALHFRTFQRPFQVAGLINYTFRERTVRFYARDGDQMRECPQWVEDEHARCRLERPGSDPR